VLAFVDVDHLKAVNDSHGHAAGDRLLVEVATAFRASLRSHDLIIRYGGDEFVCAMSGMNLADAGARLGLVNKLLDGSVEHGSVTIGLAELHPADSPDDLIARADAALYQAPHRLAHPGCTSAAEQVVVHRCRHRRVRNVYANLSSLPGGLTSQDINRLVMGKGQKVRAE